MSTVLIMGGTTFVSSSLAKHLIHKGYTVDIVTRGIKPVNYSGYRKHIICNRNLKNSIQSALKSKKYEFIFDISAYTKSDVELLLTSIDTSILKRYIFCSSGAVYKPNSKIINENFETGENPNWGQYGLDKKAAEDFITHSNIPYIIFRPTYIYGQNNNLYREVYFFDRILSTKTIPTPYGNNTKTQFIHIDDLIRCFESALYSKYTKKIYNITHPDIISWEDLILTCGEVIGKKPLIKKIDVNKVQLDTRSYFPFRDITYLLNIKDLTKDELYVPKLNLNQGLKKTYEWYKNEKPILQDNRMNRLDELCR